jgi:hypothetical protein
MDVTGDRQGHVAGGTFGQSTSGESSRRIPQTRKPWVTPAWQRLDTPMEVTMYAAQR